jgi:hypothetical protein
LSKCVSGIEIGVEDPSPSVDWTVRVYQGGYHIPRVPYSVLDHKRFVHGAAVRPYIKAALRDEV